MPSTQVELRGHIIDSYILPRVWAAIMDAGAHYHVREMRVGRSESEPSFARLEEVAAARPSTVMVAGMVVHLRRGKTMAAAVRWAVRLPVKVAGTVVRTSRRKVRVAGTIVRTGRRKVRVVRALIRPGRHKATAAALRWAVRLPVKVDRGVVRQCHRKVRVAVVIPEGRRKSMKVAEATAADRETTVANSYNTRCGMARNGFAPACT